MNNVTIRAIFFDMDHTLCDTDQADQLGLIDFQQSLSTVYGHDNALEIGANYLKVIYGEKRHLPEWQKTPAETEIEYRARLLEKTVVTICKKNTNLSCLTTFAKLFMDLRIKHFSFFPGVEKMLQDLRTKYTLVLITNGPLFSQEPKIAKVAMNEYMDHIILGGSLEYEKPHPSIFDLACQKAQCKPAEAIHVGDKLDSDIKGANDSGVTSVWVHPEAHLADPQPTPDYIINHIDEFGNLLIGLD